MLKKWLKETIQENLKRGLLVWYDPQGSFETIAGKLVPSNSKWLKFNGSYLALRFKLEDEDPEFEQNWVVYIPENESDLLKDWELMGTKLKLSLTDLLMEKGFSLDRQFIEALNCNSKELVENWNSLIGRKKLTKEVLIDSMLSIAFNLPGWNEEDAVITFISNPEKIISNLNERRLLNFWISKPKQYIDLKTDNPHEIRDKLLKAILFGELVYKGGQPKESFEILPNPDKSIFILNLLTRWRSDERYKGSYKSAVDEVRDEVNLKEVLRPDEGILDLETFPEIDHLVFDQITNSTSVENYKEKVKEIERIAYKRVNTFWVKNGYIDYWKPTLTAAKLYKGSVIALNRLENMKRDELIENYVSDWYELDKFALELSTFSFDTESLTTPAYVAYERYVDRVNRKLIDDVKVDGWPQNHTSFWSYVKKMEKPVAVIIADALRFDLAKDLFDKIRDQTDLEESKLNWLYGILPSKTFIGMAALLPDPRIKLEFGKDFKVLSNDKPVSNRQERIQYYKENGITVKELSSGISSKEADILVLLSDEFDRLGANIDIKPDNLLKFVEEISRKVSKLKEAGFRSVVISGDHGFLYLPSEPNKVSCRGEHVTKRYAVNSSEGDLKLKPQDFGIDGEMILTFPAGLSVFSSQGATSSFIHGGLSLQESVIPLITLKLAKPKEKVRARIKNNKITSRVERITVEPLYDKLDAEDRNIIVKINEVESDVIKLTLKGPESVRINWLSGFDEPPEDAEIKVVDADTGEVLVSKRVEVSLMM